MRIQQISDTLDQNGWAFTLYQSKPDYKRLAHHIYSKDLEDTSKYIMDLVEQSGSEEIQIVPEKKNGTAYKQGFAKTITINFKAPETMKRNQTQLPDMNSLNGLAGLGLSMAEIFTAKDKASELSDTKAAKIVLEERVKTLEFENMKLENKLEMQDLKKSNSSEIVSLMKSPQVLGVLGNLFSKGAAQAPALGHAAEEVEPLDPKTQFIVNQLGLETTPEAVKDLLIYMIKLQSHENAPAITKEIVEILVANDIIPTQQPKNEN